MNNTEEYIRATLRSLRKERGMTGVQLSAYVGISQSRVSKLENGAAQLNSDEVEHILEALHAPSAIRKRIRAMMEDLSGADYRFHHTHQFDFDATYRTEIAAKRTCMVSLGGIPILLQTSAYRLKVLQSCGVTDANTLALALHRTQQRQDMLWHNDRAYEFYIHEAALYSTYTTAIEHIGQLDRLERMQGMNGIRVSIVPVTDGFPAGQYAAFTLYDDTIVMAELAHADIRYDDPDIVRRHVQIIEALRQAAPPQQEAVRIIRRAIDYFSGALIDE